MWSILLAALTAAPANAQDVQDYTVDFEQFRPYTDAYGYFGVPSAATLGHLQVGVSYWLNYANDPLILVYEGERTAPTSAMVIGDDGDGIIDDRVTGNLQVGMGISRYFSLTFDLPMVLWQDGYSLVGIDDPTSEPDALFTNGVGDVRINPKFVALDRDRVPIGMAISVPVSIPTGSSSAFFGEDTATVTPSMVLEFSNGSIRERDYTFRGALHGGYLVRDQARLRDVRLANQAVYGAAIGFHPIPVLELNAELRGMVGGSQAAQNPAEFLGGLKFLVGRYVSFNLGGGAGVLPGLGAPDYRVFGGFSLAPSFDPNARDVDKDGIVDKMDRCVKEPEDLDQFQDEDGCPEADNDADNIPDNQDQCPNDPEDDDGWMDTDGCPDTDNDKDSILDVADRCPNDAETPNGYLDDDGCPDEKPIDDTDNDGYRDDVDRCPYDAEDFDQFQDEDGCPENDNDNDGIPDSEDRCINVREVFNGIEDEDGCPDEGRVVVERDNIRILEKIYFDSGKDTIQSRSNALIDEIASTLNNHPVILKVRVEGHTDSVGSDIRNLRLSQARAESVVRALVSAGVDPSRLDAAGFGEMRTIATNDTEDGRQENRRVEFIIVERE
jgi:outer membrane protein OmpA-like peptidoglycan-associated protein